MFAIHRFVSISLFFKADRRVSGGKMRSCLWSREHPGGAAPFGVTRHDGVTPTGVEKSQIKILVRRFTGHHKTEKAMKG